MGIDYHTYVVLGIIEDDELRAKRVYVYQEDGRKCANGHSSSSAYCSQCGKPVRECTVEVESTRSPYEVYGDDNVVVDCGYNQDRSNVVIGVILKSVDTKYTTGVWEIEAIAARDKCHKLLTSIGRGHVEQKLYLVTTAS